MIEITDETDTSYFCKTESAADLILEDSKDSKEFPPKIVKDTLGFLELKLSKKKQVKKSDGFIPSQSNKPHYDDRFDSFSFKSVDNLVSTNKNIKKVFKE